LSHLNGEKGKKRRREHPTLLSVGGVRKDAGWDKGKAEGREGKVDRDVHRRWEAQGGGERERQLIPL